MRVYIDTSVVGGLFDVEFEGYNSVNLKNGYPTLEIRTPEEVLE